MEQRGVAQPVFRAVDLAAVREAPVAQLAGSAGDERIPVVLLFYSVIPLPALVIGHEHTAPANYVPMRAALDGRARIVTRRSVIHLVGWSYIFLLLLAAQRFTLPAVAPNNAAVEYQPGPLALVILIAA